MRKKIIVSEFMDTAAIEWLAERHNVHYDPELALNRAELRQALLDAHGLIVRNRTRVNADLIGAASNLVVVGRLGVGLENIDTDYCATRHISVVAATGANAAAVAEYVVCMAMGLLRKFLFSSAKVAAGEWPRMPLTTGREIAGKTIGIVGFGSVGQTVARHAKAVGMRVVAFDPHLPNDHPAWSSLADSRTLEALLQESDVVSVHVPWAPDNVNLINVNALKTMKKTAVLIQVSRGGVVSETDLAAALRMETIAAAAVDVYECEPLAADSVLADVPNLFLTPHIAGVTIESNERVSALIAQRISDAVSVIE